MIINLSITKNTLAEKEQWKMILGGLTVWIADKCNLQRITSDSGRKNNLFYCILWLITKRSDYLYTLQKYSALFKN